MDRAAASPTSPSSPTSPTTPPRRSAATSTLDVVALVLLVVGGLNWALVGLFQFDLVATVFGQMSIVTRAVYVIVGLAALYALSMFPRLTRTT